jgi:hypothetical protein
MARSIHFVATENLPGPQAGKPGEVYRVDRAIQAERQLAGALGGPGLTRAPLAKLMELAKCPPLGPVVDEMESLLSAVRHKVTSVEVRYVGDLKPTTYDIDARFFHLAGASTGDDLTKMLRDQLSAGKKEALFINLANVRDIRMTVNQSFVFGIEEDIAAYAEAIEIVNAWASREGGEILLVTGS